MIMPEKKKRPGKVIRTPLLSHLIIRGVVWESNGEWRGRAADGTEVSLGSPPIDASESERRIEAERYLSLVSYDSTGKIVPPAKTEPWACRSCGAIERFRQPAASEEAIADQINPKHFWAEKEKLP
jgi:hypothetical protein